MLPLDGMAIIKPKFMKQQHGSKPWAKGGGKGKGGGGGGGKGFGKHGGSGGWVFVPMGAPTPRLGGMARGFGKGVGKGGIGKGAGRAPNKNMDKLGKMDADRKVWVGGLENDASWKKLDAHFKELDCKPSLVEIMKKGTACLGFKTADEASSAIAVVNGSEFGGNTIEVDVWTQKEKKERTGDDKPKKRAAKTSLKRSGVSAGPKTLSKAGEKAKAVDHDLKVWVGDLNPKTTWKELKKHFVDNGCDVDLCDIMKPGRACVTFKTSDDATSAITAVNATELGGETINVDVWTKPERKEKHTKKEE